MGKFKMKGSSLYGKIKLNRNMDASSMPDGRAKSSAFQLNPSMIDGVQVSDFEADQQEAKNIAEMRAGVSGFGTNKKQPKVTRTGGSQAKNILKNLSEKERKSGKKDRVTQDMLKKARKEQADPKNRAAEEKQLALNKANAAKRKREGRLKTGAPNYKKGYYGE